MRAAFFVLVCKRAPLSRDNGSKSCACCWSLKKQLCEKGRGDGPRLTLRARRRGKKKVLESGQKVKFLCHLKGRSQGNYSKKRGVFLKKAPKKRARSFSIDDKSAFSTPSSGKSK